MFEIRIEKLIEENVEVFNDGAYPSVNGIEKAAEEIYKEQREEICGYKNKIANLQKTCDARRELISFLSVIVTKAHGVHIEYWGADTSDKRAKALAQFPIIQGTRNQIAIRKLGALPHDLTETSSAVEDILEEYKEELEEILGG